MLRRGEVDAALIPSIEYQRTDGILVIPDIAVAVRDEVRSVILLSKKPIEEVESVALDVCSRTAAALTQIYFHQFLRRTIAYHTDPPVLEAMLSAADAALLIADPALLANYHNRDLYVYDWGRLWRQQTGKPFVFALWVAREEWLEVLAPIEFGKVKLEASSGLSRVIDEASTRLRLPHQFLQDYLTQCICFDLDQECLEGMDLFFHLAEKEGLIERVKPLRFWR
jgi:chorismate dehydratase